MFKPEKIIELEDKKKIADKRFRVSQLLRFVPLTAPAYRDIKEGKSIPKVNILERIAIFYGVDMNCFFTGMKQEAIKHEELIITEVNNDFLLKRIEEQAVKIMKLEEELLRRDNNGTSYTMPNVPDLKVAEEPVELKKDRN